MGDLKHVALFKYLSLLLCFAILASSSVIAREIEGAANIEVGIKDNSLGKYIKGADLGGRLKTILRKLSGSGIDLSAVDIELHYHDEGIDEATLIALEKMVVTLEKVAEIAEIMKKRQSDEAIYKDYIRMKFQEIEQELKANRLKSKPHFSRGKKVQRGLKKITPQAKKENALKLSRNPFDQFRIKPKGIDRIYRQVFPSLAE